MQFPRKKIMLKEGNKGGGNIILKAEYWVVIRIRQPKNQKRGVLAWGKKRQLNFPSGNANGWSPLDTKKTRKP